MTDENQKTQADTNATVTCPECNTQQKVIMPIDKFQHFYKCTNEECSADLAPVPGNCCIFCSYADKPCPQKQLNPEMGEVHTQSLL